MSNKRAFKSVAGLPVDHLDASHSSMELDANVMVELNIMNVAFAPQPNPSLLKTQTIENTKEPHTQHSPSDHIRSTKPWKLHTLIVKYPLSCWCFFFGLFLICGLIIALIPEILDMTTDVPFYIRNNKATTLQDALIAGRNDATWERPTSNSLQKQQQIAADVDLKLIYKIKNGNTLLTREYLEIMDKIEYTIQTVTAYDEYCKRLYTGYAVNDTDDNSYKCARQNSITNFFDKSFFKPSMDRDYTLYPSLYNTQKYLKPSTFIDGTIDLTHKNYSQQFIDQIVLYWAGYDQGYGPPGKYQPKYYGNQQMPAKFYYQDDELTNFSVGNIFASISGKHFAYDTPLDTDVDIAMSIFSFGLPLEDEQSAIGEWCFDELHEIFTQFAQDYENKIEFYWHCSDMEKYYSNYLLQKDALFMIATFVSVYLLMIFNTGSVWLASNGMLMIFMNFLPTILLYRYISSLEYFGTLCIMAMFIILSIGADDIFVMVDIWQQYRTVAPNEPMDKRLTATLKHAGKVMATTSLSTIFSFLGNTTSSFPAVYTFGAFAAWLVFVNYCSVVLFYPTVLAVHDKYFYTPNLKIGCCRTKKCAENNINTPDKELTDEKKKRPIDKFFEMTFFPLIYRFKGYILAISLVFFLVFFAFAVQLETDPEVPQFYPDGDNYQEFKNELSNGFASQTDYQLTTQIVWGIEGIDRSNTDETIPDDIGTVVYDEIFHFFSFSPDEQLYLAQFCDDLLCVYSDYNCRYPHSKYSDLLISDPENYGGNTVNCFMTEFREWILNDNSAQPTEDKITEILIDNNMFINEYNTSDFDDCKFGIFPVEHDDCFALLFAIIWLNDDLPTSNPDFVAGLTNYDYWKDSLWVKQESNSNTISSLEQSKDLKFIIVSVLTDASVSYDYNDGIELFNKWQKFGADWRDDILGQNTNDKYGNIFIATPLTLSSIMITDSVIFSYFYIQKQIIYEAIFGICISLLFAYIILTFATGNWLLSLYSCFVIFSIVVCVIGFSVMMRWKLGIIEAIIYVMVVGMSVDYVVHLSEAYLHSNKENRMDRTQAMLGIVGGSVLSGALSTLIGILWLFFTTIVIFFKFGAFIFFLIFVSLIFSMISFTAAMSLIGPQGTNGNVILCAGKCYKYCKPYVMRFIKKDEEL